MIKRETIFISHATPEDNDFSIWIASRLEMMGYRVWLDKKGLLGGERFWSTIQKAIQSSAKVLFIYSKNIVTEEGILKLGIENEIEYAKSIASENKIRDFIIPLHIDSSPYNLAIGLPNINQISFEKNWAEGLKILKKKLEKDNVPQTFSDEDSIMSEWYENEYISNCSIVSTNELFYTSWWTIDEIPDKFYMYQFTNLEQARKVRDANPNIPTSLLSNVLSTFDNNINLIVNRENETIEVIPQKIYTFTLNELLFGFVSEEFPKHRDIENHFKRLLYKVITDYFWHKGLRKYEMSNKKIAFYLPKYSNLEKISFTYPYSKKKKLKSIVGKFENIGSWHYAISLQTITFPFIGFSLKSHIIFTHDGFKIINDEKKQHSYRRKKGKRFFNEEWRDLQLAFIQRLKTQDEIKVKISNDDKELKMKEWPEMFWSEVGYIDPSSKMDLDKIEDYQENELEEND